MPLPFVGTIESDDELEGQNEDVDSEEEDEKVFTAMHEPVGSYTRTIFLIFVFHAAC